MDFTIKSQVTRDLILSKISEEQIMEYYLKIKVDRKLKISPLRKDNYPTVGFYRTRNGTLRYKDFATGQNMNAFEVVQTVFRCSYYKALRIIANDFDIVPNDKIKKNPGIINTNYQKIEARNFCDIKIESQEFSERELNWWKKYGITLDILKKFDVYSCKHVFIDNDVIAESSPSCPIYGYYGGKQDNHELWKIYFPKRKEYRFIGNYSKGKIQCWNKLPKSGIVCVITKSAKDVMCLASFGIAACAPNSETSFVTPSQLDELKFRFKYVIVFYDNDKAGMYNMCKIRKQYPELEYVMLPKNTKCKDISDFYKENGKRKTQEIIKQYCLWLRGKKNLTYQSA